ncbi:exonuclease domain-containing protein [Streptomyces violaceusniger]|uniref:exonuclease domain-containing protein n=1 Tax=Streptomyces violaceusniger TaxID=68280 RepID=UPI0009975AFB|nr:exonuclease domain-containing protein [Streptomyces hygroscopicus]AQW55249.1 DNA polymerase III subunit epsilon [Streptomyces hygroscopicus]
MWHKGRFCAFDLETTGIDVEADRVVTAAAYGLGGGEPVEPHEWMVDPGVEIPAEATAVHGISTEEAQTKGEPAPGAVDHIADVLAGYARSGGTIVGHNLSYDLTLLDRELRRYALQPLVDRLGETPLHVIDTRVLDTHADQFRKRPSKTQGPRQLITLAQVYELPWDDEAAHGCAYDAVVAARVAYRIGTLAHTPREEWPERIRDVRRPRYADFRDVTVSELHAAQIEWHADQAAGLERHFRKSNADAAVDRAWPLRPWGES